MAAFNDSTLLVVMAKLMMTVVVILLVLDICLKFLVLTLMSVNKV